MLYSGCKEEHQRGVAIMMSGKAARYLKKWEPINERLITATFNSKFMKLTILQCYAPTNESSEADKEEFNEQLQAANDVLRAQRLNPYTLYKPNWVRPKNVSNIPYKEIQYYVGNLYLADKRHFQWIPVTDF